MEDSPEAERAQGHAEEAVAAANQGQNSVE
jgi:hypothetical protein